MEKDLLRQWIKLARDVVQDEPEPYRLEAFKVILGELIEKYAEKIEKAEGKERPSPGGIPEALIEKVSKLTNKEKIQVLLYYAGKPLTKEEIKEKAKDLGIDEGWWNGSNFKRDLVKRSKLKLLIEEKDRNGVARYRLTSVAKANIKSLL